MVIDNSQTAEAGVSFTPPHAFGYMLQAGNPIGVFGILAVVDMQPDPDGGTLLTWIQDFEHPDSAAFQPQVAGLPAGGIQRLIERFGDALRETVFG